MLMLSDQSSSEESPTSRSCSIPRSSVEIVSKSISDGILRKFSHASVYDFDPAQSTIWSPLITRTAFLDSPGNIYYPDRRMTSVTRKNAQKASSTKMLSVSRSSTYRSYLRRTKSHYLAHLIFRFLFFIYLFIYLQAFWCCRTQH